MISFVRMMIELFLNHFWLHRHLFIVVKYQIKSLFWNQQKKVSAFECKGRIKFNAKKSHGHFRDHFAASTSLLVESLKSYVSRKHHNITMNALEHINRVEHRFAWLEGKELFWNQNHNQNQKWSSLESLLFCCDDLSFFWLKSLMCFFESLCNRYQEWIVSTILWCTTLNFVVLRLYFAKFSFFKTAQPSKSVSSCFFEKIVSLENFSSIFCGNRPLSIFLISFNLSGKRFFFHF